MDNSTSCSYDDPNQEKFRHLFIGGLNYETTEESLRSHFEKWGQVVKCELIKNPNTDVSCGFGFLTFHSAEQLDNAQLNRPHTIGGKEVYTRRVMPPGTIAETTPSRQIFINGLNAKASKNSIHKIFCKYGAIEHITMLKKKSTGKRKSYCFVTFNDYDSADKCILIQYFRLGSKILKVKRAFPKDSTVDGFPVDGGSNGDPGNNYDGSRNGRGKVAAINDVNATGVAVTGPIDKDSRAAASISLEVDGGGMYVDFDTSVAPILALIKRFHNLGPMETHTDEMANPSIRYEREFPALVYTDDPKCSKKKNSL